jgi:hypothetical protein
MDRESSWHIGQWDLSSLRAPRSTASNLVRQSDSRNEAMHLVNFKQVVHGLSSRGFASADIIVVMMLNEMLLEILWVLETVLA